MVRLVDFKDEIDTSYDDENEELEYFDPQNLELKKIGQRALDNIDLALDNLNSAKNWGLFDMLGGGFISSFVKHGKMDDAKEYIKKAEKDLKKFSSMLNGKRCDLSLNVETEGFLKFADIFFDNIFADFMVQDKIYKIRDSLENTRDKLIDILDRL